MPSRPPIPVELEAEIRRWVREQVQLHFLRHPHGLVSVALLARKAWGKFNRISSAVTKQRMYRLVDDVLCRELGLDLWDIPPSKRKYTPPQTL